MSWKEEWEDCCGRCRHHKHRDDVGEWICGNEDSEYYGIDTGYGDGPCPEFENRGSGRRYEGWEDA